jgi:N-hydroxyarylamine O-acetyltransferase
MASQVRAARTEAAHPLVDPLSDDELRSYLERIEHAPATPSPASLQALHLAHATHIPFENLDILRRIPIALDTGSLLAKLVAGARGGYCFEQNLLLAAVLRKLGYSLTPLAARVRFRAHTVLPRTHMLLLVQFPEGGWIADAGFGGDGLLQPVPLVEDMERAQYAWSYRLRREGGEWLLQSRRNAEWTDLYTFTLERQFPADYEMANHYMSTHPNSRFVQTLTVQLPGPEVRHVLRNLELIEDRGHAATSRMLSGEEERIEVLGRVFGLRFAAGTRFRGFSADRQQA